jgi:hypothetical protein
MKQLTAMQEMRSIEFHSVSPLLLTNSVKQFHHSRVSSFFTPLSMIAASLEMVESEAHPFSPIPVSSFDFTLPLDGENDDDLMMSARSSMSTLSIA